MKFRFVEYESNIYVVVGIGYNQLNECPEHFVCIPLDKNNLNLFKTSLQIQTVDIPLDKAIEITSKNKLLTLMVLYG